MALKTVKGISEEKWAQIKATAARRGVPIGKFIEEMADSYQDRADRVWDLILHREKNLSDKEAADMKRYVAQLRKKRWFKE